MELVIFKFSKEKKIKKHIKYCWNNNFNKMIKKDNKKIIYWITNHRLINKKEMNIFKP